jgi:hypothetical protein
MRSLILIIMFITSFGYASTKTQGAKIKQKAMANSSIDNVFYLLDPKPFEHTNRVAFFYPYLSFEHRKPYNFYINIEGYKLPTFKGNIAKAECLFGYTLLFHDKDYDYLTIAVGMGVFKFGHISEFDFSNKPIRYGIIAVLYEHEFNSFFSLGFNMKALSRCFEYTSVGYKPHLEGFEMNLPITFHFGKNNLWDFRLEPFDIYMYKENKTHNRVGIINSIGYRF